MNCPKCNKEVLIDRQDGEGRYWYVCLNPSCPEYRKAFQPSTGETAEATIKPRVFDTVIDLPEPNITDNAE